MSETINFCTPEGQQISFDESWLNQAVLDDSVVLAGSNALEGVRFGDMRIELFEGEYCGDGGTAHGIEVYPLDGQNSPVFVNLDRYFDIENPYHLTALIRSALHARSSQLSCS